MPSSTHSATGLCPLRPRALVLALCAAAPLLAQASVAGRFQFVFGEVRVLGLDGREREARKGQEVLEGETLSTGANASAQLKMIDGGFIAMRPQSQLKLDAYAVQGGTQGQDKAQISLAKGGFRSVTGLIGKTNKTDYSVATPTATIGIRGTDHEPVVIASPVAGAPAADPPGTYDKVNTGATSLSTQAGTAVIAPNQVGYAGSPTQAPVVLPTIPSFFQSATPPANKEILKTTPQSQSGDSTVRTSAPVDTQPASATPVTSTPTAITTPVVTLPLTGVNSSGTTFNSVTNLTSTKTFSPGSAMLLDYSVTSGGSTTTYSFSGYGPELTFTRNSTNQITGVTLNNLFNRNSYSVSGSTLTDTGQDSGTGLSWGRWQGGQLSQTSSSLGQDSSGQWGFGASTTGQFVIGNTSQTTANQGSASLHWITTQQAYPQYLPQALTGSATYTLLGGTRPSDSSGNLGTLNSATLSANFTAQTIDAGVNFSLGGNAWVVQSTGMPLQNVQFQSSICSTCTVVSGVTNTFTKNGVSALSSGSSANLFGQLTGTGLNGAALGYNVSDASNILLGVAGFSGPTQNTATAFRAGTVSNGFRVNYNTSTVTQPSLFTGALDFSEAPASRVVSSSAGLSEFLGTATYLPTGSATFVTSGAIVTAKIGTAVNRDLGSTTIDTVTVSWGRWEGGSVDIYSVDGLTKIGSISNLNRSMHWVASGTLTSLPSGSLPMTGSATYALAGSTSPTDLLGNVGTLGSVTLNADFGNMRANASVTASFSATGNAATWSMTANGMPIRTTGEFQSSTALSGTSGITHTTSCSGTGCGSQNFSALNGVFVGTGASGAVMSYRMVTGNAGTTSYANLPNNFTPTNAVTGLAVLKK